MRELHTEALSYIVKKYGLRRVLDELAQIVRNDASRRRPVKWDANTLITSSDALCVAQNLEDCMY